MANKVKSLMGAGFAALQATSLKGAVADSLTATGSTQGTALALTSDNCVFTTVAASTGCILPANPDPMDGVIVANLGANALSVYPATGGAINSGAANAAFSIGAGKVAEFFARPGSLNWVAILSA